MDALITIGRVTVGLLFLYAAAWKITAPRSFVIVTVDFQVLPTPIARFVGWVIPFFEASLGLALVLGLFHRPAAIGASVLLVGFTIAVGVNLARGRRLNAAASGVRPRLA